MRKVRIAILFGGKSAEHEVSVASAKNVYNTLDKNKYEPVVIGIDKTGKWHQIPDQAFIAMKSYSPLPQFKESENALQVISGSKIRPGMTSSNDNKIDVVFPVLHGPYGEDGSVQGMLELANIPYVGAGVLGSAVGMDKDVMKRLLRDAGIPIANFLVFQKHSDIHFQTIKKLLKIPFFVKPANMGSSVGVSKVSTQKEFAQALEKAYLYDTKILIEEAIIGRELECSVLGNDNPIASVVGEIILNAEFYSYEAKYIDEDGAVLEIPAKLPKRKEKEIQKLAIQTFTTLCLTGLARVDFFMAKNGDVYVNEVNTIPGFTNISMYPKLWEKSGLSQKKLIDKLIQLAIERHEKRQTNTDKSTE